jgi:LysM repeat protein
MEKFFYRVQEGDSLFSISEKFNIPACVIIKLNNLKKEVSLGDILYLEYCEKIRYKVKLFDTAESVAQKFGVDKDKLLKENGVKYLFYGIILQIDA